MEDWKETTLADCVSLLGDGLHGTPKYSENGEYAFINGNNLIDGKILIKSDTKRVDEVEYQKYKKNLTERTILVSINGTLGNVGTYNNEKVILGKSACYFNVKNDIDKNYIKYIVSSKLFRDYLENNATGTTIKNVSLAQMRNYKFTLPPLSTQQKIAQILSSLDDKIELNNQINANLEQQIEALFKSWFVDFEPFGGEMPSGWKVGKLSEIANYSSDKISISELNNDTYYSTENMLPNKAGVEAASTIPNVIQTTRCFPGETIISNIRPYFKKIYYCTEEKAGCSTDVLCFKPITENYSEYLYQILYSDKFFDYMVLGSKGTKMPRGDKQQIMNYEIVIPNDEYIFRFASISKQILRKIDSNRKENKKLSSIRDILLPKLMSRELEID